MEQGEQQELTRLVIRNAALEVQAPGIGRFLDHVRDLQEVPLNADAIPKNGTGQPYEQDSEDIPEDAQRRLAVQFSA